MNLLNYKAKGYLGKKIAFLSIPLLLSISSCSEDFLVAEPELDISDVVIFETPERAEAAISGLYLGAKHGRLFGGRYLIYNDIKGEEFLNRTTNVVTGYSTYQFTNDASDTYIADFWNHGYLTINKANIAIAGLEANTSGLDGALVSQFVGEAKFIRALCYFGLVQIFAKPFVLDNGQSRGLPLRLQPETGSDNNELAPSSVGEVYNQILADLDAAIGSLPADYNDDEKNVTRAHVNAAIALKVRVLLAKGDYAGVITEGNRLVPTSAPFIAPSGISHRLQPDITSVFSAPYLTAESIFSFPMAATNNPGGQNQLGLYYNIGNGNLEYTVNTSSPGIFTNPQWGENDDRRTEFIGVEPRGTYFTKFAGVSPFVDYVPIIRYAEVLLNVAEAEAEVGDVNRAKALLEAVHHRSDAAYEFGTLSRDELIEAILVERRIELMAEGFRANDAARRGLPHESVGAGSAIPPTDNRYVFPIPILERQTNPAIGD
ncbi:RagB/SusD family nutrient uptake outer membrane protein [Parapedobacter koreensis]|uniref:SusD family protein n=1 Tax=Parapedobacter koreensis TaxID=332977 RepID=A0A1H7IME6_9SPHI|nr:RagB/SusD family nutrient uptake outer membrane protein [Parapedobacter koreensis]SEK62887.1 SusD family protein [Parapedobacter koreensis]